MPLTAIGFDADDTLWHHETYYRLTEDRFVALLAEHTPVEGLRERLLAAERRNLQHYGFGVKGFTLSMIETAIEVTDRAVPASVLAQILDAGREMLEHPIDLLPHAKAAVTAVAEDRRVLVVTKGDLMDQERKLAQSGLGDLFAAVEIVSEKSPAVYARIFARHGTGASEGMMVGNSLKSDVLPMLDAGGWGVHVPHDLGWVLDQADPPAAHPRFRVLGDLGGLVPLIADLTG